MRSTSNSWPTRGPIADEDLDLIGYAETAAEAWEIIRKSEEQGIKE